MDTSLQPSMLSGYKSLGLVPVRAITTCAALLLAGPVAAQDASSPGMYPLDDGALAAVVAMFGYDRELPLDVTSLGQSPVTHGQREAFAITGVRGDRVPGYLAVPDRGSPPYPLVLLMHAGAFSKDSWWTQDSYGGRPLTDALLESGLAVGALDAQYHGGRSHNIGFMPIRELYFEREWFGRVRDLFFESVGDYRRVLDYLSQDSRIDLTRVGAIGHSTGGIMALDLAAVDDRVSAVVGAVAALSESWLYPISPTNMAPRVSVPVLLLAGTTDALISLDQTQRLYEALPGQKDLVVYDSGHELPVESNVPALEWVRRHLGSRR